LGDGSENTPADRGQNVQRRSGLLQFIAEAKAQIPGADLKHLFPTLSHPQALMPASSRNNSALSENQRKEFKEKSGLGGVLLKVGPNCRHDLIAGQKDAVLRRHEASSVRGQQRQPFCCKIVCRNASSRQACRLI
jgi:hypothetical protein